MFDTNPNDDGDDANNDYDDANEDYDGILAWSMFDTVRLREFTRRAKKYKFISLPAAGAGVLSDRWFIYQHTSLHTVTPNFNLEEDKGSCWGK